MKFFEHNIVNSIDADKRANEWHVIEEQAVVYKVTRAFPYGRMLRELSSAGGTY